jgi:hypothetical protein
MIAATGGVVNARDQRPPTSRIGLEPSQFIAACLTRSKNVPFAPLMSEISITVPGCDWVSK